MSDNWIVNFIQYGLNMWNDKLSEIWQLLTVSPTEFKGGVIWDIIVNIHGALQAIGLALLVLFFVSGIIKTCGSFTEIKRPEQVLKLFVRFGIAQAIVTYGLELMMAVFKIVQGIISTIMNNSGLGSLDMATILPSKVITAIEECGFLESVPLWAVSIIGVLIIIVLSFMIIMSVYGRFFKLYMYTAIAPIPLSAAAGEPTQNIAKTFAKSYCVVCLEGAIIILACVIFSVFANSPPIIESGTSAMTQVMQYLAELIFNMLVLVGTVKLSDHVVKEMIGN